MLPTSKSFATIHAGNVVRLTISLYCGCRGRSDGSSGFGMTPPAGLTLSAFDRPSATMILSPVAKVIRSAITLSA